MFLQKKWVKRTGLISSYRFFFSKEGISNSSKTPLYDKYRQFHNVALEKLTIPGVTLVKNQTDAIRVANILQTVTNRDHAWDTETIDLDAKAESPVGRGKIICASVFCGPDIDFGSGPRLFIDNFGRNSDLILTFKEYLENPAYKKIWHNYGFDRHIFYNHGIDVRGFGGDTLHMARLAEASRGPKEYSLSSLTTSYANEIQNIKKNMLDYLEKEHQNNSLKMNCLGLYRQLFENSNKKTDMKRIFATKKILKSGAVGKSIVYPSIIEMHTDENLIKDWVFYSTLDAELTYFLKEVLSVKLMQLSTNFEGMENLLDLYYKYWLDFGEILTDMERVGIKVNLQHLQNIQKQAEKDLIDKEKQFKDWVKSTQTDPNIDEFNPSSTQQLQQLFFAPFERKTSGNNEDFRQFDENEEELLEDLDNDNEPDPQTKKPNKILDAKTFSETRVFKVLNTLGTMKNDRKKPNKFTELAIKGLGMPIIDYTASGLPSVDISVLKKMAGDKDKQKNGLVYAFFEKQGEINKAIEAQNAIESLIEHRAIETLIQTYIIPLQVSAEIDGRIHCSLNLNTETGRLSARRPNLQNQPALEKDIYKIRMSFEAEKGKKLIVADYGQLELRILAHITNCKNMIEGFKSGGDFHSRTAISMYPHIRKEVDEGKVLLEWDKSKGAAPAPLIKDKYAAERRKAKTMNFSLAYGKSAHGFAKDWDCSMKEANEVLEAWYNERKEVKQWQENVKRIALERGWTKTLMGRYRNLTKYFRMKKNMWIQHGLRAAINTPIQGGAADIVIAAMVKIHKCKELKEMGWKILLQIHDELILEGPEETAKEALAIVKEMMRNPLDEKLRVELEVDAKIGNTWYESK